MTSSIVSSFFFFGPHLIPAKQIFFVSRFSVGIVNIRPILPGHCLVVPRRLVARVKDLNVEEICDLFLSVQQISSKLEIYLNTKACNIAIQDGPESGQSVPHVHVHILPRNGLEFHRNDDVHSALESTNVDQSPRTATRSLEDMCEEAARFSLLFDEDQRHF